MNWVIAAHFLISGAIQTIRLETKHRFERTFCMWVVPSGLFGLANRIWGGKPYDVYALGSDIWKIGKIPIFGRWLIKTTVANADGVFADAVGLAKDVTSIAKVPCAFLTLGRVLPAPTPALPPLEPKDKTHFLFVGRYHPNKGPDLLLDAVILLPERIRAAIRIHMFGYGELAAELKEKVRTANISETVTVGDAIGEQALVDHLHQVSYFLLPSRIDSIPVVVADCLQSGAPIIANPVGDLPLLLHRYKCGILASEVSAQAFAAAMVFALECDRTQLLPGVKVASRLFDISVSVKRWLNGEAKTSQSL